MKAIICPIALLLAAGCRSQPPGHPGDSFFLPPTVCDLTRGSQAAVEATVVQIGSPEGAQAAGLSPAETPMEDVSDAAAYRFTPVTLAVRDVLFGQVGATSLEVIVAGDGTTVGGIPLAGDGGDVSGYFFLVANQGHLLVVTDGFLRSNGDGTLASVTSRRLAASDFLAEVAQARAIPQGEGCPPAPICALSGSCDGGAGTAPDAGSDAGTAPK